MCFISPSLWNEILCLNLIHRIRNMCSSTEQPRRVIADCPTLALLVAPVLSRVYTLSVHSGRLSFRLNDSCMWLLPIGSFSPMPLVASGFWTLKLSSCDFLLVIPIRKLSLNYLSYALAGCVSLNVSGAGFTGKNQAAKLRHWMYICTRCPLQAQDPSVCEPNASQRPGYLCCRCPDKVVTSNVSLIFQYTYSPPNFFTETFLY